MLRARRAVSLRSLFPIKIALSFCDIWLDTNRLILQINKNKGLINLTVRAIVLPKWQVGETWVNVCGGCVCVREGSGRMTSCRPRNDPRVGQFAWCALVELRREKLASACESTNRED